jgi:dTDP-4-dehydrorhamnose reductase
MYAPARYPIAERPDDHELPDPPLPLLITGISGVTGYNALRYFQAKYPGQVFGLRQTNNLKFVGPDIIACDAEDHQELRRVFDHYQFAAVLDCAGNCALKPCELNPEMAWMLNVGGVRNLLTLTTERGIRLVHLSIDLVFHGLGQGGLIETDAPEPVSVYGKTMVEGERSVSEMDPSAATLRISLPMGVSFNGHAGAVDWIESRFKASRPATLYFDEVRTPTYTTCLTRVCQVVLAGDQAGVYHAGGPRCLSLYQIAQIINRVGGYDPDLLYGMPRGHAGPIPPRAGNVTMDSTKLAESIGFEPFDPWPLEDSHVPDGIDWHRDRPTDEKRSPDHLYQMVTENPRFGSC